MDNEHQPGPCFFRLGRGLHYWMPERIQLNIVEACWSDKCQHMQGRKCKQNTPHRLTEHASKFTGGETCRLQHCFYSMWQYVLFWVFWVFFQVYGIVSEQFCMFACLLSFCIVSLWWVSLPGVWESLRIWNLRTLSHNTSPAKNGIASDIFWS